MDSVLAICVTTVAWLVNSQVQGEISRLTTQSLRLNRPHFAAVLNVHPVRVFLPLALPYGYTEVPQTVFLHHSLTHHVPHKSGKMLDPPLSKARLYAGLDPATVSSTEDGGKVLVTTHRAWKVFTHCFI